MEIREKFSVMAPIKEVWNFINDPLKIADCIPGCERVEKIDERTYESLVKAGVGPIKVHFKLTTILTQIDEPRRIKMETRGADLGFAGSVTQSTEVNLKEVSENETEISYSSNITVVGRIALFGERIMRAKAKELGEQFVKNIKERLERKEVSS
jgi:carbon monoxide dehydrogenase subunit G